MNKKPRARVEAKVSKILRLMGELSSITNHELTAEEIRKIETTLNRAVMDHCNLLREPEQPFRLEGV